MLKAFSFLILLSTTAEACRLKRDVVSISAPVTGVLRELGLLLDPNLKAISLFHPVGPTEFTGPRLGGGLFLSKKEMSAYKNAAFFYDQSAELSRRLKRIPLQRRSQIQTRGLDPFAVTEAALDSLTEELTNCDDQTNKFRAWLKSEKEFLTNRAPFKTQMYFFLGEIQGTKLPHLMIVQDGPVLFWLRAGKLKTLATDLSYVSWGEKWRSSLKGSEKLFGLVMSKPGTTFKLTQLNTNHANVFDPEVLSPGPWQIRFMRRFVEQVP